MLVAVVFWVLVTWYSSRILVYKRDSLYYCGKDFFEKDKPPRKRLTLNWILFKCSEVIGFHLPRLLGYLCFPVIALAYLQLPIMQKPLSKSNALLLLLGYVVLYAVLTPLFDALSKRLLRNGERTVRIIYWASLTALVSLVVWPIFLPPDSVLHRQHPMDATDYRRKAVLVIVWLTLLQQLYLFLVVSRRNLLKSEEKPSKQKDFIQPTMSAGEKGIRRILLFVNVPNEERLFFYVFNGICLAAILIYLFGVFNLRFATNISSLNFAVLAFGILVGFFGLVSILSIHTRINFHIIFFLLVIILGQTREPHYVRLVKKESAANKVRPDLKTYFANWLQTRRDSIAQRTEYPVFFILADGGASRSGYWVASVLGQLHDSTNGRFDNHLFALSGASGGSVGNGAYFALLYNKAQLAGKSYTYEGQDFLRRDFLSYTLARMLGPDFFRPLLPLDLKTMKDRAGALETAMEEATGDTPFLRRKLAVPFTALVPDTVNRLPVLCINTTRMQDGRPGVISNILIEDEDGTFGKRVDVLKLLSKDADMRLSTAVVMGARFPYVNPAGRIDSAGKDSVISYFVDGGYFDNSGAGVVHEMIVGLQEIIEQQLESDSAQNAYLKKISFYVIHITNSPSGNPTLNKVHPLRNDLMAPVSTLVGSFSTQTDVNDSRLEKYLDLVYPDTAHYLRANLYLRPDTMSFPMNWTISNYYQNKMKERLNNPHIRGLVQWVKQKVQ